MSNAITSIDSHSIFIKLNCFYCRDIGHLDPSLLPSDPRDLPRMKLLVTSVLLIGATFGSAALVGNPGGPSAQQVDPNPGSCGSKWDDLTSFVGEEIIMKAKEKMMGKAKCCFKMNPTKEWKDMAVKCAISTVKITMKGINDGTAKTPTTDDWKIWYENYFDCNIKELNIPTTATGFDKPSFKNVKIEDFTDVAEDKMTLRTLFNGCIDAATGSDAIKQMLSVQRCFTDGIAMKCNEKGESEGMMIKVAKAFLTLWDDSPCSGVQFPQKLTDIQTTCMAKMDQEWTDKGFSKFTSTNMMKYSSDIKNAMYFLKEYGMNMMGLLECGSEEMGFFNSTTGLIDYQAGENFLSSLEGWKDTTVMNSVVMGFKDCEIPQNVTTLMKMSGMERDMAVMKHIMKFKKCFMPKFIKTCGLNNELSKVFFPMLNNNLIGSVAKDFKAKNGVMAIMHIVPAIREKFSDVFAAMNMTMMSGA